MQVCAFQSRQTLLTNSNQVENGRDWKNIPQIISNRRFRMHFRGMRKKILFVSLFHRCHRSALGVGVWGPFAKKTVSLRSIERKVIRFNLVSFDWNVRFQINTIFLFFACLALIVTNEPLTRAFHFQCTCIPRKPAKIQGNNGGKKPGSDRNSFPILSKDATAGSSEN